MSTGPNFFSISSALASKSSRFITSCTTVGHARIVGRKFLQRVGELPVVDVAEDHLGAFFVQRLRDTEANAAGAAGDVADLVFHILDGRAWEAP